MKLVYEEISLRNLLSITTNNLLEIQVPKNDVNDYRRFGLIFRKLRIKNGRNCVGDKYSQNQV